MHKPSESIDLFLSDQWSQIAHVRRRLDDDDVRVDFRLPHAIADRFRRAENKSMRRHFLQVKIYHF